MSQNFARTLTVQGKDYSYYPVSQIEGAEKLPFSLKVLLENVLRHGDDAGAADQMAQRIVQAGMQGNVGDEIEFSPARVLFQDFTGVPVFVDFAVMREACADLGGDPKSINPQVPCDLVIDHSVIADYAGTDGCSAKNTELEFERNAERYEFLKWAQASFKNVRIVPPGQGICHQLNIEQFATVVMTAEDAQADGSTTAYFDTLVGTDSHTPTANGIGVLGWGVGGIEAEAAALGQPITTLVPQVIGIHLTGSLKPGVMAMDVALTFAQKLREKGVVGCFVECFGEGVSALSATQRACIANMTPEYGSTCTLFPVDERTLDFLKMTGRSDERIELVRAYAHEQGFWNTDSADGRAYADVLTIDLGSIEPSISGPSRPHDRVDLKDAHKLFEQVCAERALRDETVAVEIDGTTYNIGQGAIAIAAVTSCTTATDPNMMIQAGLAARNAAERGLTPKPWVKTIFAPGSHATEMLLGRAGLLGSLSALGFCTCGFGCMSCIGNSGPLMDAMHDIANDVELASVLSGNRNFDGRISPDVSQNYLTTPAHVIAYALAGTMDIDIETEALGVDNAGNPVYLRDIMPEQAEIDELVATFVTPDLYTNDEGLFDGDSAWQAIKASSSDTFDWNDASTYVRRAPYFDGMERTPEALASLRDAAILAFLDDFITTDHISPAGSIALDSPAAEYLHAKEVSDDAFNTYGSRRGNHEVMMRGTFANVKLQNKLAPGRKGGWTTNALDGSVTPIFSAYEAYARAGIPSVVIAGKMYGSGSSRDWAAKGPMLLGVRAVIAESFERIHRSNLIGMGLLPLQFMDGESAASLGLDGTERITIDDIQFDQGVPLAKTVGVHAKKDDGSVIDFEAVIRIDTPTEGKYYENGGILPFVLRELV